MRAGQIGIELAIAERRRMEIQPFRPRSKARPALSTGAGAAVLACLVAVGTMGNHAKVESGVATASVVPAQVAAARRAERIGIADPAPANVSHSIDYRLLDARLSQLVTKADMVGMAVAVIENGQISFLKGYGSTQSAVADPVTDRTVFRWASLSKGVAATLVTDLASEGKLRLTDPIAKYSPTLRLPKGNERVATVEDLLSHRLGIYKNAYDDRLESGVDPRAIRESLSSLTPMCAPGACFAYQNVAYDAAHEVVEHVTGESYAAAVKEKLFAPLGMSSASVTREGLVNAASWARPHVGRRELEVKQNYYNVPAAGGVNSSILDLALWMRAQMGEAKSILPAAVLNALHAPRISTARSGHGTQVDAQFRDQSYGLGFREFDYQGHQLVGHRGAVSGYRSLITFDPAAKTGVAVLWNSQSIRPVGVQLEVLDMFYHLPRKDWMQLDSAPAAKGRRA